MYTFSVALSEECEENPPAKIKMLFRPVILNILFMVISRVKVILWDAVITYFEKNRSMTCVCKYFLFTFSGAT